MFRSIMFILAMVISGAAQAEGLPALPSLLNGGAFGIPARVDEYGCFDELVKLRPKYPDAIDIATRIYRRNACDTLFMVEQWLIYTNRKN